MKLNQMKWMGIGLLASAIGPAVAQEPAQAPQETRSDVRVVRVGGEGLAKRVLESLRSSEELRRHLTRREWREIERALSRLDALGVHHGEGTWTTQDGHRLEVRTRVGSDLALAPMAETEEREIVTKDGKKVIVRTLHGSDLALAPLATEEKREIHVDGKKVRIRVQTGDGEMPELEIDDLQDGEVRELTTPDGKRIRVMRLGKGQDLAPRAERRLRVLRPGQAAPNCPNCQGSGTALRGLLGQGFPAMPPEANAEIQRLFGPDGEARIEIERALEVAGKELPPEARVEIERLLGPGGEIQVEVQKAMEEAHRAMASDEVRKALEEARAAQGEAHAALADEEVRRALESLEDPAARAEIERALEAARKDVGKTMEELRIELGEVPLAALPPMPGAPVVRMKLDVAPLADVLPLLRPEGRRLKIELEEPEAVGAVDFSMEAVQELLRSLTEEQRQKVYTGGSLKTEDLAREQRDLISGLSVRIFTVGEATA